MFGTLTYAKRWPGDGRVMKRHLDRLLKSLRRRGISAFWVLEFQARGAPHLHLWLSGWLTRGELTSMWLRSLGSYAQRGYYEHQRVNNLDPWHGGTGRAAIYIASYAKKEGLKAHQKVVPFGYRSVGRFWGQTGERTPFEHFVVSAAEVRTVRRAYVAKRRSWGCRRPWRDRGRRGFVVRDLASLARGLALSSKAGSLDGDGGPSPVVAWHSEWLPGGLADAEGRPGGSPAAAGPR